jgi:hypothetical protein
MAQTKTDEILTRLERIERKIDQSKLTSIRQWVTSFGFGLMIASVPMIKQDLVVALTMLLGGLVFILLSAYVRKS